MSSPSPSYCLIMAGGAGTRLWPISRTRRPKQFQAFLNEQTLLQHMVEQATQVVPLERIFIMATPEFAQVIRQQVPGLPEQNLLYEPCRRDNGPAIILGMLQLWQRDPSATVALLWSDHAIQRPEAFARTLRAAFAASAAHPDSLVTVGTKPTQANTQLGYIQLGDEVGRQEELPIFRVKRFVEKPDLPTARLFAASWEYLWNVGYKVMAAAAYLDAFRRVHPELQDALSQLEQAAASQDQAAVAAAYQDLPAMSDEYLLTRHLTDLLVVPGDIGWSDIGTWNVLHAVLQEQSGQDTVTKGAVLAVDSRNSLVFAKDRQVVALGVSDLVIVDDGDVLLVMAKQSADRLKETLASLATTNQELL